MQTLENLINKKVKQRKYINLVDPKKKKKKEAAKGNDPAPENRTKNHDMDRYVKSKVQSRQVAQDTNSNNKYSSQAQKHRSTTTSNKYSSQKIKIEKLFKF